jgi:hypothetical protein
MALREILVAFGFDVETKDLEKGEKHADGLLHKFESLGTAIAAAFAVHEVKSFFEETLHGATELAKSATMYGMAAQSLQELEFAAAASNVSVETLHMGIMRLQRSMFAAGGAGGAEGTAKAFSKLGIAVKDASGKTRDTTDLLEDVAEKFTQIQDPAERTGIAMKLFGRGGAQMIPFLLKGKEGIEDLRKEMHALGGGFTDDFIEKAHEAHEAEVKLDMATKSLRVSIVTGLFPAIMGVLDSLRGAVTTFREVTKEVDLGRIALSGFLLFALGNLPTLIGLVKTFALESAVPIAGWILLAVAIEDIIGLMTGADSLTGTFLDRIFGEGSAESFRKSVVFMTTSWEGFTDTIATTMQEVGGVVYAVFQDLFYWLLQKLAATGDAVGKLLGKAAGIMGVKGDIVDKLNAGGAEQHIIDKHGEANATWYQDMKEIKDSYVARREDRGYAREQSEAMIENAKPGVATRQGTTELVNKHYTLNDKTVISVNTLPATTGTQAREVGAAVKKAKAQSGDPRATLNALEPAVE